MKSRLFFVIFPIESNLRRLRLVLKGDNSFVFIIFFFSYRRIWEERVLCERAESSQKVKDLFPKWDCTQVLKQPSGIYSWYIWTSVFALYRNSILRFILDIFKYFVKKRRKKTVFKSMRIQLSVPEKISFHTPTE